LKEKEEVERERDRRKERKRRVGRYLKEVRKREIEGEEKTSGERTKRGKCGGETAQGVTREQPQREPVENWEDRGTGVSKMPQASWSGPPCPSCLRGHRPWPPQPSPCSLEPSLPFSSGTVTAWAPKTCRLSGLGVRLGVSVGGLGDALRLVGQAQGALGSLGKDPGQKA